MFAKPPRRLLETSLSLLVLGTSLSNAANIQQAEAPRSWIDPTAWRNNAAPSPGNDYFLNSSAGTGNDRGDLYTTPSGTINDGRSTDFRGRSLEARESTTLILRQNQNNVASILGGSGDFTLSGGTLIFQPTSNDANPVFDVDKFEVDQSSTGHRIQMTRIRTRATIDGILTGPGDLFISERRNGNLFDARLTFTQVDEDFTGLISVRNRIDLDFGSDVNFAGSIDINGDARLRVSQVLRFRSGDLTTDSNGTIPDGIYFGASLSALGGKFVDAGGALVIGNGNEAPVHTVTTLIDEVAANDDLSLREALQLTPLSRIVFDPSLDGGTIQLDASLGGLRVENSTTVDASDLPNGITIDGGSNGNNTREPNEIRCFIIDDDIPFNNIAVTLRGLTIQNGITVDDGDFRTDTDRGGNIYNAETLRIEESAILRGQALLPSQGAGGIYGAEGSRLFIRDSRIDENFDGGIFFESDAAVSAGTPVFSLLRSSVANNKGTGITIQSFGNNAQVGGVAQITDSLISDNAGRGITSFAMRLRIHSSTIARNTPSGNNADGGGILFFSAGLIQNGVIPLEMINSTVVGNVSPRDGGGLAHAGPIASPNQTSRIIGCTFAGNIGGTGSFTGEGGGIDNFTEARTLTLSNCLIIGNSTDGGNNNISGGFTNGGGNQIGGSLSSFLETSNNDPLLRDNGGFTPTVQLAVNSPAIDAGDNSEIRGSFDQRGANRIIGNRVDIGAVEFSDLQTVTTLTDELDDNATDGDGISLREALRDLAGSSRNRIVFSPLLNGGTINLTQGELVIDKSLNIDASTLSQGITIDAGGNGNAVVDPGESRVFRINNGNDNLMRRVELINLTIQNGTFKGEAGGGNIYNREDLTLTNCHVLNGTAIAADPFFDEVEQETISPGGGGGGIRSEIGLLTLENSVISGNQTFGDSSQGGGIDLRSGAGSFIDTFIVENSANGLFNDGGGLSVEQQVTSLTLTRCDVSRNQTNSGGDGGGTFLSGSSNASPVVNLLDCLIADNSASGSQASGGGIDASFCELTITNCTIANNSVSGNGSRGGGMYLRPNDDATNNIIRSTFTGNHAPSSSGGNVFLSRGIVAFSHCTVVDSVSGGGLVANSATTARFSLFATIVRDNQGGDVVSLQSTTPGNFTSLGDNLVGTGNAITVFDVNEINTLPIRLAPLGDFGGLTPVRPPLAGSPAINRAVGSNSTTDQLGFSTFGTPDIGAVEFQGFVVTTLNDEVNTNPGSGQGISLREAIQEANANFNEIVFDIALDGGTIQLEPSRGPLVIDQDLIVSADGLPNGIIIDGGSDGDFSNESGETNLLRVNDGNNSNRIAVTLRGLTLQNGIGNQFSILENHEDLILKNCQILNGRGTPAIRMNNSSLTLLDSLVSGNHTSGTSSNNSGGGIQISGIGNSLTIERSEFSDNRSEFTGGAIATQNTQLAITDSVFENNRSAFGGGAVQAGTSDGFFERCTFLNNRSTGSGEGGAIEVDGFNASQDRTNFIRCTFIGNSVAQTRGGAISIRESESLISHCTIVENTAPAGNGGGIDAGFAGQLTVEFSLIRDNVGGDVHRSFGSFRETTENLVGTGNALNDFARQQDASPILLSELGNFGGLTPTRVPLEGSPVIDQARSSNSTADQRGFAILKRPDIGATESEFTFDPFVDPDGDGLPLVFELALGTDPATPSQGDPRLPNMSTIDGVPTFTFGLGSSGDTLPGTVVIIERSTTLETGNFKTLFRTDGSLPPGIRLQGVFIPEIDNFIVGLTEESPPEQAFYRVRVLFEE